MRSPARESEYLLLRDTTGVNVADEVDMAAALEVRARDIVRLRNDHGDVRAGTLGRVLGRFAREDAPRIVVAFDGARVCDDVRSDELVLVDDVRSAA